MEYELIMLILVHEGCVDRKGSIFPYNRFPLMSEVRRKTDG
jgi:hypothetical protein